MPLRIFDSRTRRKVRFRPPGEEVRMYICGPTVYDYAHLGHAKAYVTFDVVRRYLEFMGWRVLHVMNFTDIEDSITRRAQRDGVPPLKLAERFIKAFLEDMDRLKVRRAHVYPRVTEHIEDIIDVVDDLVKKDKAYVLDGDVYMRAPPEAFGDLSGRPMEEMVASALPEESERERSTDFALWKKASEGEPSWPSPWGDGRPGWHVECFAMSTKYLGPTFDIHGGGMDLIFPHHESEAIVAEAHGSGQFARHWLHNGFMTLQSQPMSKSVGNFVTIREILEGVDWEVLRYFLLRAHYRATIDYSEEALAEAGREHAELAAAISKLMQAKEGDPGEDRALLRLAKETMVAFIEAMDDDFNTPKATMAIRGLARAVNRRGKIPADTAQRLYMDFCGYCSVLGLCEEKFEVQAPTITFYQPPS